MQYEQAYISIWKNCSFNFNLQYVQYLNEFESQIIIVIIISSIFSSAISSVNVNSKTIKVHLEGEFSSNYETLTVNNNSYLTVFM